MTITALAEWIFLIVSGLFCLINFIVETWLRRAKGCKGNGLESVIGCDQLVSVLVPAYNEEHGIERTIRAILSSNWSCLEVVVVDDGSSDRTAQIVAELSHQDARIKLVQQPYNQGKANALNVALAVASAAYVVVVDGDTMPDPEFVSRVLRPLLNGRADAVAGNVRIAGRPGLVGALQAAEYVFVYHTTRLWQGRTNSVTTIAGAAGGMRRSAVVSVGGYSSDTMAEDADLTLRLRQNGFRVVYLPDAIVRTEVPCTWRTLFHQRVRWFYGNLQCIGRQLRRADGGVGLRLSGVPIFVYENLVMSLVELGRACIPIVVAFGWTSVALLYAYLGLLLVNCGSVVLAFRWEEERVPPITAIVARYSIWPIFLICPNLTAVWKLLTHQPICWRRKAKCDKFLESPMSRAPLPSSGIPLGQS